MVEGLWDMLERKSRSSLGRLASETESGFDFAMKEILRVITRLLRRLSGQSREPVPVRVRVKRK